MRQLELSRQLCGDMRESVGGDFECGVPLVELIYFKATQTLRSGRQ